MEVDCALGLGGCSSGRVKDESVWGLFDTASRPTLLPLSVQFARAEQGPFMSVGELRTITVKARPLRRLHAGMVLLPASPGQGCLLRCGASACVTISNASQHAQPTQW